MNPCYVYAKCWGSGDPYLQQEFSGTRAQCETYLRQKVRQGRPVHFNFISTMGIDKASRKYL